MVANNSPFQKLRTILGIINFICLCVISDRMNSNLLSENGIVHLDFQRTHKKEMTSWILFLWSSDQQVIKLAHITGSYRTVKGEVAKYHRQVFDFVIFPVLPPQAGSYVALTVQGRPPGSPQIPLADSEVEPSVIGHMSPIMTSPHSPGASGNMERITSPVLMGVRGGKASFKCSVCNDDFALY